MPRLGFGLLWVAILSITVAARSKSKLLQIYFLDTEGGQATWLPPPRVMVCFSMQDGQAVVMPRALSPQFAFV